MSTIDYQRLLDLKALIDNGKSTRKERKEYMELLYRNGNITKDQYDSFLSGENSDEVIEAALTIGGVLIATWLISKLFE